jgi:hypothetical protein
MILLLACAAGLFVQAGSGEAPVPNIRSSDGYVLQLLSDGSSRSRTFRRLVDDLKASDLVIYVRIRKDASDTTMRFVSAVAGWRYVEIAFPRNSGRDWLISLLGHELQHALEVARSPEVRTNEEFARLYERIGVARQRMFGRSFETDAALLQQRTIFGELTGRREFERPRVTENLVAGAETAGSGSSRRSRNR